MEKKKVVFICVHNSCRSQIAEALGKHLIGDCFECYSTGTEVKSKINQDAVRIMKEIYGIDMEKSGQHSKLINEIPKLLKAGGDLQYLLNQGYNIKGASAFVGNHYLLSERQRLGLVRAISSEESIITRKSKEIEQIPCGSVINIDGFNTIITLEVALSDSLLLKCMDGTIRDLASLRGTYRLIDKTDTAIL